MASSCGTKTIHAKKIDHLMWTVFEVYNNKLDRLFLSMLV